MRVQRVAPNSGHEESWTLLGDDWRPIEPVEQFLAHLTDQRRSPNTVKAYAHDLKDYFTYLEHRHLRWQRVRYGELAAFKPWLRTPPENRTARVATLPFLRPAFSDATVSRKLAAVTSFYEYHRRHGITLGFILEDARREVRTGAPSFRRVAHPPRTPRSATASLRVRVSPHRPVALDDSEVERLLNATTHRRDELLVRVLNEGGLRIGEALGLRHEDVHTADGFIDIRARVNANGARAKTYGRRVPLGAAWFALNSDYWHYEYGDIDSDYLFIRLWSSTRGIALSYPAVSDLFRRLSRRTGLKATPHMLRHSYATRLLRAGVRAEVVRQLLGHASVATTINTYAHLTMEDVRRDLVTAGILDKEVT